MTTFDSSGPAQAAAKPTIGSVIPSRYAKLINDPANRYKVPTQYLPANLRQLRTQAQARKVMLDPTATVQGPALELAAQRIAGLEINPQISALQRQQQEAQQQNAAVSQRVADFNAQYMNNLKQMSGTASGPYADFFKSLQTAAPLGAASAQRDLAYDLGATNRDAAGKISDLQTQRGALQTKALTDLRQQQFENLATRQTLGLKASDQQQTAALEAAKLKSSEATTAAKLKADQAKQAFAEDLAKAKIDIARGVDPITGSRIPKGTASTNVLNEYKVKWLQRHPGTNPFAAGSTAAAGGVKYQPPATQQNYVTAVKQALPYVQAMKKAGLSPAEARRRLLRGAPRTTDSKTGVVTSARPTFKDLEALVAIDQAYRGHITPITLRRLKSFGIKAGQFGIPVVLQ